MIHSLTKNIRRALKYGMLISTLGLVLSVLIQIYGRFFLEASPPWTEEASRLFFIYTVAFGAAPAFIEGYFISLDLLPGWIPDNWKIRLSAAVQLFILVLCGALAVYAFQFVRLGMAERSPGMGMRMGWAFLSVVLLFGSIALLGLLNFFRRGPSRS